MAYYKLDLNDFFDKKYETINKSSGIGGVGFITPRQSIHVYNDKGIDEKTNQEYLGIGDHYDITKKVISDIYGIDERCVDSKLYNLISIKYWNSEIFKIILMYFPKTITLDEFEFLKNLREYYDYIFSQYKIKLGVYEFGSNTREYEPDVKTISDINPIIEYARDRIDINKERSAKEKILTI